MTEALPSVVVEPVWFVEATYAPDAAETRILFRAEHLARIVALREAGVFVEVGAFIDVSASIVLVRAESAEAALAIVRDDVYLRNGVWVELRARAFGRVVGPAVRQGSRRDPRGGRSGG
jgi:uncharacterized protein YciI